MANSGRSERTFALAVDNESRSSEELIQDKTFLLASIVEYSDDAIMTKTSKGIITSWNHGAERIYGFSAKDMIGKSVSILIPPGQTDEVPALLERIGRGGSLHHYETMRRRKDGRLTDVLYNASVYMDTGGKVIGVFAAARDVTVRKRIEEELAELEKFQKLTVGRELKMVELKKEIGELRTANENLRKRAGQGS